MQEQFRRAAVACLAQRVQVSLASAAQQASAETEQLLETQSELAQRGAHLQVAVRMGLGGFGFGHGFGRVVCGKGLLVLVPGQSCAARDLEAVGAGRHGRSSRLGFARGAVQGVG